MSEPLVVEKEHVVTLLNGLWEAGRYPVRVAYPPYGVDLLELRRGFEVRTQGIEGPLQAERERLRAGESRVDEELPTWWDLKDCLQSSGAVPPENLDDVGAELLALLAEARRTPTVTLLGPDTNMAYMRLFSRHLPHLARRTGLRLGEFRYALSEAVVQEVDRRIRWKYGPELAELRRRVKRPELLDELRGRNRLSTRKGKIAQAEVDFLRQSLRAFPVPAEGIPEEKEAVDIAIAESYGRFQKEHHVALVVLTSDQNMVDHLANAGVRSIALQVAFGIPPALRVHHWTIPALLHDLALTFGVIQVGPYVVYGEWRGKSREDYVRERLRVELDGGPLAQRFQKDVGICRLLMEAAGNPPGGP